MISENTKNVNLKLYNRKLLPASGELSLKSNLSKCYRFLWYGTMILNKEKLKVYHVAWNGY